MDLTVYVENMDKEKDEREPPFYFVLDTFVSSELLHTPWI